MPGILPMKVIKVGTSSQSRIAQACDRCRSKKIRCDGVRPTCTQCASVGFECKTSDKLSRRAFPRGYTESLEERVRALEGEVRELKDLLDEKDEKIDMLSRMHANKQKRSPISYLTDSAAALTTDSPQRSQTQAPPVKQDAFKVQASPLLLGVENSDSYYMGPSSARSFIDTLKRKLQETGKPCRDFNPEAFLRVSGSDSLVPHSSPSLSSSWTPPRLFSDRSVNVFFQEWAPLFPVLHKPTFLKMYEEFIADPDKVKDNHKIAQLHLVFSIAGLAAESPELDQVAACEERWRSALGAVVAESTMHTLQCLVLAIMYCTVRADHQKTQHYKAIAVGLSHRLGLHQSQKRFSFGALTTETRKKVFWTLYTLDCFTAATLGLPKLLREDDVHVEFPSDADDEYITEKGFQPTLPGEHTRLSNALALFRVARVLARVLDKNYPAAATQDLSLRSMEELEFDLNAWHADLPSHLRLNFKQDKPSTDVTGSRSPLLSFAFYLVRTLIYRPAVGSGLGNKAAPALLSIGDASKRMIQITKLLHERNMTFAFCVNKSDALTMCAMTLIYQTVDLKKDSKLIKDNERLITSAVNTLVKDQAPGSLQLKRVANLVVKAGETVAHASNSPKSNKKSPDSRPECSSSPTDRNVHVQPSRMPHCKDMSTPHNDQRHTLHRPTSSDSQPRGPVGGPRDNQDDDTLPSSHKAYPFSRSSTNLDFMPFNVGASRSSSFTNRQPRPGLAASLPSQHPLNLNLSIDGFTDAKPTGGSAATDWETLVGSIDGGLNNVYDAIYGGHAFDGAPISPPITNSNTNASDAHSNNGSTRSSHEWSRDTWDLSYFSVHDDPLGSVSDEAASSGGYGTASGLQELQGPLIPGVTPNGLIVDWDGFPL